MPARRPPPPSGPTYRLVLQREDDGSTVAQYQQIPHDRIQPILDAVGALVHVAGLKRQVLSLLGRLGA